MPFGVSPVLEVDGTKISGSLNILRYLGEKFGKLCITCSSGVSKGAQYWGVEETLSI